MSTTGSSRKPATGRSQSSRKTAMPRSTQYTAPTLADQPRRHKVNQKEINGMVKMRIEGVTHAQIAQHYRVSPRTVGRHTKGVSAQLVHAGDDGSVELLAWGVPQFRSIQQRERLRVHELDFALKEWRKAVSDLDELTRGELERDPDLRARFLRETWPPIHESIADA